MNYKISYLLMRILGVGGILVMLVGGLTGKNNVGMAGAIAVIVGMVQSYFFFNCPHCKRPLRVRDGIPDKCPYCKKPLG